MSFISLLDSELKKLKRSKMLLILFVGTMILWVPSIINADLNFNMQDIGILPENNFFIQGFMGMSWFMLPACMVVVTVLLNQTEKSNNGIIKLLSLPINTGKVSFAKFIVLVGMCAAQIAMMVAVYYFSAEKSNNGIIKLLSLPINTGKVSFAKFIVLVGMCAAQIAMMVAVYYFSAVIAGQINDYNFILPFLFVIKSALKIFVSTLPMLSFFWMLSVCISTPVFSVGIGLASVVPSVILLNTKVWYLYPMCYPFYFIMTEQSKMAENIQSQSFDLVPLLPVAVVYFIVFLAVACIQFGKAERK